MRALKKVILTFVLGMTISSSVLAHDGWIQSANPIIETGEVANVEIMNGNHSNAHASYRIAGKYSVSAHKFYVTAPNGRKIDISSTVIYMGEDPALTGNANDALNSYYLASFTPNLPGAYIITSEGESSYKSSSTGLTSRTIRVAKSFLAASDLANRQRVSTFNGFSKSVVDQSFGLELIPRFNPVSVKTNTTYQVYLNYKGTALKNTDVSIIARRDNSPSSVSHVKSDNHGIATFKTREADEYLVRVEFASGEKLEGKYDSTVYESTMTFKATNQSNQVNMSSNKLIDVYVNGEKQTNVKAQFKNNQIVVQKSFINDLKGIQNADKNEVNLRLSAEKVGYKVEYFAPIAGLNAAVHLYK
jgi:uncharacterized GH25 family protein